MDRSVNCTELQKKRQKSVFWGAGASLTAYTVHYYVFQVVHSIQLNNHESRCIIADVIPPCRCVHDLNWNRDQRRKFLHFKFLCKSSKSIKNCWISMRWWCQWGETALKLDESSSPWGRLWKTLAALKFKSSGASYGCPSMCVSTFYTTIEAMWYNSSKEKSSHYCEKQLFADASSIHPSIIYSISLILRGLWEGCN